MVRGGGYKLLLIYIRLLSIIFKPTKPVTLHVSTYTDKQEEFLQY